ncbi:hypothetical protein LUZ60_007109 [Juncus effusus]|nr:hypothetical protein LUZ60_007109 [Juncus effusus]
MASSSSLLLFFSISLTLLCSCTTLVTSKQLGLEFHHRFSDKVQQWAESHGMPATWNTEEAPRGSVEYYELLIKHDLHHRHGRSLAEGDLYSFSNGNETVQYLAYLHYTYVDLGTPNQTFLVALDTGSHLFWLPCNCQQCAPHKSSTYGNIEFTDYMPNASSTSKSITCSSDMCDARFKNQCINKTGDCDYSVGYASGNTSTSGVLMEDILYFTKEDATNELVKLPIVFGCGEKQTGDALTIPNGIMGLGIDTLSVPTMLAKNGTISDSFSMCFGLDGTGRIKFGDKGNTGLYETPLVVINPYPYYNINMTEIVVGNKTFETEFTVIVDSGTSLAYLVDPFYTQLAKAFSAQIEDKRLVVSGLILEYCYELNTDPNNLTWPELSFTTKGGSPFPTVQPIVLLYSKNSQDPVGYCLTLIKSDDFNIFGEVFLSGLNVVFNREELVLGWQEADCYGAFKNNTMPYKKKSSSPAPAPAPGPYSKKSWAPHISPHIILNSLIYFLTMIFSIFLLQ